MRDTAGLASLAGGHVVQHVLHGPAVGQRTLPHLSSISSILLLPISSLTLVSMQQQHQLLLDQLPLLRVCRVRSTWRRGTRGPCG